MKNPLPFFFASSFRNFRFPWNNFQLIWISHYSENWMMMVSKALSFHTHLALFCLYQNKDWTNLLWRNCSNLFLNWLINVLRPVHKLKRTSICLDGEWNQETFFYLNEKFPVCKKMKNLQIFRAHVINQKWINVKKK